MYFDGIGLSTNVLPLKLTSKDTGIVVPELWNGIELVTCRYGNQSKTPQYHMYDDGAKEMVPSFCLRIQQWDRG